MKKNRYDCLMVELKEFRRKVDEMEKEERGVGNITTFAQLHRVELLREIDEYLDMVEEVVDELRE